MTKSKNINTLKNRLWELVKKYLKQKYQVCQICKMKEIDDIHHIVKKSLCEYLRFDYINLIPICRICHHKAHPERRYAKGFDPLEWHDILLRLIGAEGIEYLQSNRHNPKNWWSDELEKLIDDVKIEIKELEK